MSLPSGENSSSDRFYVALAAGAAIVLLLIGAAVLFNRGSGGGQPTGQLVPLPFGPAEQAYAAQIHFSGLKLSQADNMLNQEFTYVVGTVSNSGNRSIRAIQATVEFHDLLNQVVLRDTVRIFAPGAPPLAPGHERDFQLTFEHVSAQWNRQPPSLRVTGLELQ
ncbi:MAG TPA: FxLYD domain-containing protein [Candidatus Acidoferrales bacterium]|nr:FxLYD domain-containing protein [Candidatus Acidoferrales bacterium]